ncbi:MAG TPA: MFS transporter, partial [Chloroflexota bacterium]|nr:MFS transporter [Chloroflexota bacterium]
MYVTRETITAVAPAELRRSATKVAVSSNVLGLGFTSLFTDISSEMVSAVLPMYLVLFLRLSPLQFGLVDGLYQGVGALVKIA